jgi:hypothetical protein
MKNRLLSVVVALFLIAPNAVDASSENPLSDFLKAADNNEFTQMQSLLDSKLMLANGGKINPAQFIDKVSKCYLRRVYADDIAKRLIAAWMCDEGAGKSRVVIATLGTNDGKVQVRIDREDRNDRPAPPRIGSALGDDKK